MSVIRQIDRFPMYDFHSDGRIYSRFTGRFLKPLRTGRYLHVVVTNDQGQHRKPVHRLIAEAFHGAPTDGVVVNHKNCDTLDNNESNLEWVTQSENVLHAYRLGRRLIDESHRARCAELGRAKRSTDESTDAAVRAMFSGRRGDITRIANVLGITRYVVARIVEAQQ